MSTTCSKTNKDDEGSVKNTSFVVENTVDATQRNVVAGYFTRDGNCKTIAVIGDMNYKQGSKDIRLTDPDISEVFLFVTRGSGESYKLTPGFKVEEDSKNIFNIADSMQPHYAREDDEKQYPH